MQLPNYNSPRELENILTAWNFGMQKKFGQNFLISHSVRAFLAEAIELKQGMPVWEVGPGLGSITSLILQTGANLTAFEIDRGFSQILRGFFGNEENFTLVEGDVLKTWKTELRNGTKPLRFFGNLPYNIGARLIGNTISDGVVFDRMLVTVQKEVGQRMAAAKDSPLYSGFSVLCQWVYDVKLLRDISPTAFWPQPNVRSAAVLLTKKKQPAVCENPQLFVALVRGLFAARRKTIRNTCKAWMRGQNFRAADRISVDDIFSEAKIDPSLRAENLTVEDFLRLTAILHNAHDNTV